MTATIMGCTGLIGSHLAQLLTSDNYFDSVRFVVRREVEPIAINTEVRIVDFNDPASLRSAISGSDTVFCAIGTTQKKVHGNKEEYRKIDYEIPVTVARFAAESGVRNFILVSSVGADEKSKNFYLKLKGDVEKEIKSLPIPFIGIIRPSLLLGKRNEKRPGEKFAQMVMPVFSFLMKGKSARYRPIPAKTVAAAMISIAKKNLQGSEIYEYRDIVKMANDL